MKSTFNADKLDVGKLKIDKTRTVNIDVAEYELDKLVDLFSASNEDHNYKITVEWE